MRISYLLPFILLFVTAVPTPPNKDCKSEPISYM